MLRAQQGQCQCAGFSLAALASLPRRVVSCPDGPAVAEAAVVGIAAVCQPAWAGVKPESGCKT